MGARKHIAAEKLKEARKIYTSQSLKAFLLPLEKCAMW